MLKMMLDGLDDHNRIVDDDPDRQNQTKERKVIQAVPDPVHNRKGSDDGHRDSDQRNHAGAPRLKKCQHDDGHKQNRIPKRLEHLHDRFRNKWGRVIDDLVVDPRRETRLEFIHLLLNHPSRIDRIGTWLLVDRHTDRWLAIQRARGVLILGTKLDATIASRIAPEPLFGDDLPKINRDSRQVRTDDNPAELRRFDQATFRR